MKWFDRDVAGDKTGDVTGDVTGATRRGEDAAEAALAGEFCLAVGQQLRVLRRQVLREGERARER